MTRNGMEDPFASKSINYWAIICRRRWCLLLSLAACWAVAYVAAHAMPTSYTSNALVLVAHTGIPDSYVELNVKADLVERMRNISERVFDQAHLEKIIENFHLYPKLRAGAEPESAVNAMRHDIKIDPLPADDAANEGKDNEDPAQAARRALVPQNGKTPDAIALRLSYSAPDRFLAQNVASELVSLMIEENMKVRRKQSEITTNFLENQTDRLRQQLNLQQKRIQEFKSHYMGEMPDQKEGNIQSLSQLQSRLQSANEALASAEQQKIYLSYLADQYKELQTGLTTEKATTESRDATDQQLDELEKQLADLKSRYTDAYPEVRSLQDEITRIKALKAQSAPTPTATPTHEPAADPPPSLPRPKTFSELQALSPILQIDGQIKSNEAEIANRRNEVKAITSEIEHYQGLLTNTPLREQQLDEMTHTYTQLKGNYDSLAATASQSQLATNLEKQEQGEQWEILSPPNAPRKPSFPDRFLFSLTGLGTGLALGIGLLVFKELTDDRIFEDEALKGTGQDKVDVIGRVPPLRTGRERKMRHLKMAYEWAIGTGLIVVMAGTTTLSFFRG